jgi:hypothetical protein
LYENKLDNDDEDDDDNNNNNNNNSGVFILQYLSLKEGALLRRSSY